jgi:hypothetical protein
MTAVLAFVKAHLLLVGASAAGLVVLLRSHANATASTFQKPAADTTPFVHAGGIGEVGLGGPGVNAISLRPLSLQGPTTYQGMVAQGGTLTALLAMSGAANLTLTPPTASGVNVGAQAGAIALNLDAFNAAIKAAVDPGNITSDPGSKIGAYTGRSSYLSINPNNGHQATYPVEYHAHVDGANWNPDGSTPDIVDPWVINGISMVIPKPAPVPA